MSYVTGKTIRELREKRKFTQKELAERLNLSDKTISKWETGKGLPDIGVIDDLSKALGISIGELLTGEYRENEFCITLNHPMEKNHYISFIAYVTSDHVELAKLYPEQGISVRFRKKGHGHIYAYCNRHGMFEKRV